MPKFEKGHPGGPGRPRGSRNVVNLLLDQLAEAEAETMVRKMIDAASEGDRVAARLVLSRIWSAPILRDAAVPATPQDEAVRVQPKPHPEECRAAAPLEGCEPALPGQPVAPPSPDMEIRPTRWRARTAQDYDEEERPGTNGRCLTEYDVLRDEDDDDE